MSPRLTLLAAILSLAGCVATEGGAPATTEVGPGNSLVDAVTAGSMFAIVCAETAPSFANAPAELASLPFVRHPETGTYYHHNLNLSIKLMPKACSMVFASNEDASVIGLILASGVSGQSGSKSNEIAVNPDSGNASANGPGGTKMRFERSPYGLFHVVLTAP